MTDLNTGRAARRVRLRNIINSALSGTAGPANTTPTSGRIPRCDDQERRIPSPGQRRLWFLDRLLPGSSAYNVPLVLRLRGSLDLTALHTALREVVRRHVALRTTFAEVDGVPVAGERESLPVDLDVDDVSPDRLVGWLADRIAEPFDLAADALIRTSLARIDARDHLLCVVIHHIACDGWSQDVLTRELLQSYVDSQTGGDGTLPGLAVQYADVVAWERSGGHAERDLAYWRERLAGAPERLELPTDFPRHTRATLRGDDVEFTVPTATAARLRALAREQRASLFMVLLGAFHTLLGRYTGQPDVVVGTPTAGRSRAEAEALIGFFVNTVPLRARVDDVSFRELVDRCRSTTLEAYEHQHLPFERLVDELTAGRSNGHDTLVRATLQLDKAPAAVVAGDLTWERVPATNGAARFDLELDFVDHGERLTGTLRYAADLFARATGERLVAHLGVLLDAVVADPDRAAWDVPLWTRQQRATADTANDTAVEAGESCLHELIERQAARTPRAVAVSDEDTELTFEQLDSRANSLAWRLRALGAGPDRLVGVCLPRSVDLVVALLGVLKAGAAYVPLDPDYPAGRVRYMVADAAPPVVITDTVIAADRFEDGFGDTATTLLLDREWPDIEATEPDRVPLSGVGPDNLVYVIYTSGSSGLPKGAMNTHRAVVNHMRWLGDVLALDNRDVVAQKTPFGFDVSAWELFLPLMTGCRMVLARPGGHRDPRYLAGFFAATGTTVAHFVPSMLRAFVDGVGIPSGTSLRMLLCSGEALAPQLADRVLREFDGELLNLYGPTETAIHTTWRRPRRTDSAVLIGRPLWNTVVRVLGADGTEAGFGLPGELCLGGVSLGRGYHGRPALTAERFVPDPHVRGQRMYRTGDLVRWRDDGELEFLGRMDDQVKVNGLRIELGEVETVLGGHPAVRAAAARVVTGRTGDTRLIAYVVPVPEAGVDPAALRAHLRDHLPTGWIPQQFVAMERFPLTPSGKLDRAVLPKPAQDTTRRDSITSPRNEREARLAEIWAALLGVPEVGVEDDFFELGGNSLQVIQLVARIEKAVGVRVPVQRVFDGPTVAELAAALADLPGTPAAPVVRPRADRGTTRPLSYGQQRLWFLDRIAPGSTTYNVQHTLALRSAVEEPRLAEALAELVARHEILRTAYRVTDGIPEAIVLPADPVEFAAVDLTGLPPDDRDAALCTAADAQARLSFNLEAGPVLRALLVRMGTAESALVLTMHHIAVDGWSLDLITDELVALYHGTALPEPTLQYADYAMWQREHMSGARLTAGLDHWRATLADAPDVLELATDLVRPKAPTHRGGVLRFRVDADLADGLRVLATRHNATLFMVLLAGFAAVIGRHGDTEDVVVGTPVAGRGSPDLDGLVGFLVNTVPLRTDLAGDPTFVELIGRVRTVALAAFEHQDVPFEKLVDELTDQRDTAHHPICQVMFELYAPRREPEDVWARVLPIGVSNDTAKFDLTLFATDTGGTLDCGLRFATDVCSAELAQNLVLHWQRVLTTAIEDPDARISRITAGPAADSVVYGPARPALGPPVHETVSAHARRTPDAVAVLCGESTLTYRQLDLRVAGLAHRLAGSGVGPESLVAVQLPRGVDLVVALLAVWRAGAAFLALDPDHPRTRRGAVLTDARPELLLTDGPSDLDPAVPALDVRVAGNADRQSATNLLAAHPDNLAHVVYTSGSSGVPKGIAGTHRGVRNYFADLSERGFLSSASISLAVTTVSFDACLRDLLFPLTAGARVVVAPSGAADPERLVALLVQDGVTALPAVVPSVLRMIAAAAADRGVRLPALRTVQTSGEVLHPDDVVDLLSVAPNAEIVNMYGPSETTMTTTRRYLGSAPPPHDRRIDVGDPIANARLDLLDDRLNPVGIGVPGNVYIAGAGLTRGYYRRPGLTADRFRPHPTRAGERMHDTGDRGRLLPDGGLQYLGRTDDQLKINGVRVDPTDVEVVLAAHPAVAEAAVAVRGHLVAYLVVEPGREPPVPRELRAHLADQLPASHLPSAYVPVAALPKTSSGKIDRNALPDVAPGDVESGRPPATPTEELVATTFAAVLGRQEVGVDQDFFTLGGHSLLAAQLSAAIGQTLSIDVPLRVVFELPTAAELAAWADRQGRDSVPELTAVPAAEPVLTASQRRLLALERRDGRHALYNMPIIRAVRGSLDAVALAAALTDVVARHEPLRTVYRRDAAGWVPVVRPAEPVPVPVQDVSEDELAGRIRTLAARVLDLERGPVLRAWLLRLGPQEHVLHLTIHHMAADGWSVGVLLRDLTTAYRDRVAAGERDRSPLPVRYADFAQWQQRYLAQDRAAVDLAFWRAMLAGMPALFEVAGDYPGLGDGLRPPRGRRVRTLSQEDTEWVAGLCLRRRVTPFMALLTAFQVVLGQTFASEDFGVAVPMANRDRPALDGVIGFVANTAALRADLSGGLPFAELVLRTRNRALDAYAHRDMPFEVLLAHLAPEQANSHAPLVQAMFNMQDFPHGAVEIAGLKIEHDHHNEVWARYPITLFAHNKPEGIVLDLVHDSQLFDDAWADRLLAGIAQVLAEGRAQA